MSISSIVRWKSYIIKCFRDTLIKLEIDHSMRVSDSVVPDLLKLQNLKLLSMAGKLTKMMIYCWILKYRRKWDKKTDRKGNIIVDVFGRVFLLIFHSYLHIYNIPTIKHYHKIRKLFTLVRG